MNEQDWLAQQFEDNRRRLRAVAYRMLGSVSEADDAVQEAWLRLSRSDPGEIENLAGWLTTVVARVSLNMLRSRDVRGARNRWKPHLPDPIVDRVDGVDPEHEALLADSVGLAMLVVLETLTPPERLAFVLHDMFGVPVRGDRDHRRPLPAGGPPAGQPGPPPRPGSAAPPPTLTSRGNERSSMRSWRRRAMATSTRWSRPSTPTSCCVPTAARPWPPHRPRYTAR